MKIWKILGGIGVLNYVFGVPCSVILIGQALGLRNYLIVIILAVYALTAFGAYKNFLAIGFDNGRKETIKEIDRRLYENRLVHPKSGAVVDDYIRLCQLTDHFDVSAHYHGD